MQTVIKDDNITLCLWANLNKSTRFVHKAVILEFHSVIYPLLQGWMLMLKFHMVKSVYV